MELAAVAIDERSTTNDVGFSNRFGLHDEFILSDSESRF